jgi:hypothetical protein
MRFSRPSPIALVTPALLLGLSACGSSGEPKRTAFTDDERRRCADLEITVSRDGSPRYIQFLRRSWPLPREDATRHHRGWWGVLVRADDCKSYHAEICAANSEQAIAIAMKNAKALGATAAPDVKDASLELPDEGCALGEVGPDFFSVPRLGTRSGSSQR